MSPGNLNTNERGHHEVKLLAGSEGTELIRSALGARREEIQREIEKATAAIEQGDTGRPWEAIREALRSDLDRLTEAWLDIGIIGGRGLYILTEPEIGQARKAGISLDPPKPGTLEAFQERLMDVMKALPDDSTDCQLTILPTGKARLEFQAAWDRQRESWVSANLFPSDKVARRHLEALAHAAELAHVQSEVTRIPGAEGSQIYYSFTIDPEQAGPAWNTMERVQQEKRIPAAPAPAYPSFRTQTQLVMAVREALSKAELAGVDVSEDVYRVSWEYPKDQSKAGALDTLRYVAEEAGAPITITESIPGAKVLHLDLPPLALHDCERIREELQELHRKIDRFIWDTGFRGLAALEPIDTGSDE